MPLYCIGSSVGSSRRKFLKILENKTKKKNSEKPWFYWLFGTFSGGDKRDRTADLLNAIQRKSVGITGFLRIWAVVRQ